MDADGSYRNLSEKDIIYEIVSGRRPELNDRELEAGYAASEKCIELIDAPIRPLLCGLFDCAIRLGYKEEAVRTAVEASTDYEATGEMHHLALGKMSDSRFPHNSENNKKEKKKAFVPASSTHSKESQKEQRGRSDPCMSVGRSETGIVHVPLAMGVADDMEVEKGERSVFLCISNRTPEGRYGCDWYRLDLVKKECSKIFGRLEWEGISTTRFGVATVGSIIYILGGLYPASSYGRPRPLWGDVFYLDVVNPGDGWKEGPQLPSPLFSPVATAMNETVYIFNGKYVFAWALDTSDSESDWMSLVESPNLELPSDLRFLRAFPDPIRDRILLFSSDNNFFAYYPRKGELECMDSELQLTGASAVVDGVLYHHHCDSNVLLRAYDLDEGKFLTPHYLFQADIAPYDYCLYSHWDHLLDLGGGKLCLVKYGGGRKEVGLFLKLKVQKEDGGDKVHITVVSFDMFRIVEDSCFEHSVAL